MINTLQIHFVQRGTPFGSMIPLFIWIICVIVILVRSRKKNINAIQITENQPCNIKYAASRGLVLVIIGIALILISQMLGITASDTGAYRHFPNEQIRKFCLYSGAGFLVVGGIIFSRGNNKVK